MAYFKQTFVDGVTVVTAAWLNGIQEVVGAAALAPDYEPTETYAKDALVSRDNQLYICVTPISSPEAWTPAHWRATSLEDLLSNKADVMDAITNEQIDALF